MKFPVVLVLVKTEPLSFSEPSLQLSPSRYLHFSEVGSVFYRQCLLQSWWHL